MTKVCRHDVPSGDPKRPRLLYFHASIGGVEKELTCLAAESSAAIMEEVTKAIGRAGGAPPIEYIIAPETCAYCRPSPDGDGYIGAPAA
jgi:hypothetical protein